jgi:tetratricopeptide (TPR) repeat protein
MSPEQALGQRGVLDHRTDIYSLGVTLYELLTLEPAFNGPDRQEVLRQIACEEPYPPRRRNRSIPAELETVVLKALAKSPAERYGTAQELADDLRRFLEDRPVLARRPTLWQRLAKWAKRHRGLVWAGVVMLVVLALGSTVSALLVAQQRDLAEARRKEADDARKEAEDNLTEAQKERRRAEANFAKAWAVVDEYLTKVSESQLLTVPGLQPLRRDLLTSALSFYRDFLRERGDDPTLQAELAAAQLRVGKIYSELGSAREARKAYREAQFLYQALVKTNPRDRQLQNGLADCYYRLEEHTKAIEIWAALVQAEPSNRPYQRSLASAYNYLGNEQHNAGKIAEALEAHRKALALRGALVKNNPDDPEDQANLGATLNNIGVLLADKGRPQDALAMYRRAAEHAAAALTKAPHVIGYGRFLAISQSNIAVMLRRLDQSAEALRSYRQSVDTWQKLASGNPAVPYLQASLWNAYWTLGNYQRDLGRTEEAARSIRLAREVLEGLPKEGPGDFRNLASVRARCAELIAQGKNKLSAEEEAERRQEGNLAIEALRQAITLGYKNVEEIKRNDDLASLRERRDFKESVARLEEVVKADSLAGDATGPAAERLKAQQEALRIRKKVAGEESHSRQARADVAASLHAIGLIQAELGQMAEAAQSLAQAVEIRTALVLQDPKNLGYQAELGTTHLAWGDLEKKAQRFPSAIRRWHKGLEILEAVVREEPRDNQLSTQLAVSHRQIGDFYAEIGLWEEAAQHFGKVFAQQPPEDDGFIWRQYATLLLLVGDKAAYSAHCARILGKFGGVSDPNMLWNTANACGLAPEGITDAARLVQLAKQGQVPGVREPWRDWVVGLAYYRAGQFQEAIQYLGGSEFLRDLPSMCVVAMAHHRLGHAEEARKWLRKAEERYTAGIQDALVAPSLHSWDPYDRWTNWAWLPIFHREAKALIEGSAFQGDPLQRLLQARAHALLGQWKEAEADFQAAAALGPDDPEIWWVRGRLFDQLGKQDRAEADFAKVLALGAGDAKIWIARGRYLAERGRHPKADAAFARAATRAAEQLHQFIEAGWWVVGPYPEDLRMPCPPEKDPDPSRPVAAVGKTPGSGGKAAKAGPHTLNWQYAPTGQFGQVELGPLFNNADHISAYALTYVASPEERSAMLLVGGEAVRVWLNGRLVHENTPGFWWEWSLDQVPVTLRAGRNTLLVKVSKSIKTHTLALRLADSPIDRGRILAELGLWEEAALLLAKGYGREAIGWEEIERSQVQATLCLASGNVEEYRRQCEHVLDQYARAPNPNAAFLVARAYGLTPEGLGDPARLVRVAKEGLTPPHDQELWRQFCLGLVYYRAGRFERAIEQLSKPVLKDWPKTWAALAMAHHRLGHVKEARKWLAKADEWYDNATRNVLDAPVFSPLRPWGTPGSYERAEFEIVHREAEALIDGSARKADANRKALQARAREELKRRDKATADYDHALGLAPEQPRLWVARGRRFDELKQGTRPPPTSPRPSRCGPAAPGPRMTCSGGMRFSTTS